MKKKYPTINTIDIPPKISIAMHNETMMMICRRIHNVINEIEGNTDYFIIKINDDVAKSIGLSDEDLIKIRSEKLEPSVVFLHFLCKIYKVNPMHILFGTGEKFLK